MRKTAKKTYQRTCPNCKSAFKTEDKRKRYCTRSCGITFRTRKYYYRNRKAFEELERQSKS